MISEATVEWEQPTPVPPDKNDPRIQAALAELRERILRHFPAATFDVHLSPDGDIVWLDAIVDVDDLDEVTDIVLEREVELQVEEGVPVGVMGRWPEERIAEYDRQLAATRAEASGAATARGAVAGEGTA